jgi:SAM-dependent methyltransferase
VDVLARRPKPAFPELLARARKILRAAPPGPFVDVGCGGGELLELAGRDGRPGFGVDLDPDGPAVLRADAAALPFPSGRFGLAASLLVAHYLRDPDRALAECRRVLRRGGLLILADRVASDDPSLRLRRHRIEKLRNPRFHRLLTPGELREAAVRAGFRPRREEALARRVSLTEWLAGLEAARARRVREALGGAGSVTLRVRLIWASAV